MKIILVAVTSMNGKISSGKNSNVHEWTSSEDSDHFFNLIKNNNLIVMGSQTYEASKSIIKLVPEKLRMVLTRDKKKYEQETVKSQLEFTSESPKELIERLEQQGYTQMLLAGGGEINKLFLKHKLVDEIYLTIEPKIFGEGKSIFSPGDIEANLELISVEKLNKKGTILLKYKVLLNSKS